MPLIPVSKQGKIVLVVVSTAAAAGIVLFVLFSQPSPISRHATDTAVHGYEQLQRYSLDENAIEIIYTGPPDEQVVQRVSAPDLKMSSAPRVHGPTRYDWVADGKFEDGCRLYVKRIDPDSLSGRAYKRKMSTEGIDESFDIVSLNFVCGTG